MSEGNGPGRPAIEFEPEQIDRARELLGRTLYPSKAVDRLAREFGFSRPTGYKLLAAAREAVINDLTQGGSGDPAASIYLFLEATMADEAVAIQHRLYAANAAIKLLYAARHGVSPDATPSSIEAFLAGVMARRMAHGEHPLPDRNGAGELNGAK